jgi:hypothetical protein
MSGPRPMHDPSNWKFSENDVGNRERMRDRNKEFWVDLYRMAMMERENAKIAGRIGDDSTTSRVFILSTNRRSMTP